MRSRSPQLGWQEVRLYLRDFKDVDKKRFRSFLKDAVASYFGQLETAEADPERAKPWQTEGQQWHLSQRGVRKRHLLRWEPALLMAVLGRLKSMQADLIVRWDRQTSVQFAVRGEDRPAGRIVTNMPQGLRVELITPKNACTPTQVDRLGQDVRIKRPLRACSCRLRTFLVAVSIHRCTMGYATSTPSLARSDRWCTLSLPSFS